MSERRVKVDRDAEKQQIEELRKSEPDRVTRCNIQGKADCLRFYQRIVIDSNESEYCECTTCQQLYYFNSKDGTSTLKKHLLRYCGPSEYREAHGAELGAAGGPGRKADPVWDHWTVATKGDTYSTDIMRCIYCEHQIQRSVVKCREHIMKVCTGETMPEGLREDFEARAAEAAQAAQTASNSRQSTRKRKKPTRSGEVSDFSEDSMDFIAPKTPKRHAGGGAMSTKNDAINLFSDFLENLGMDAKTVRQKKPYSQYSEDDWKREERELAIKERRAKIRHWDAQTDFYNRLGPVVDRVAQAAELFIAHSSTLTNGHASGHQAYGMEPNVEVLVEQKHRLQDDDSIVD